MRGALPVLAGVTLVGVGVGVGAVWAVGSLNALTGLQRLLGQAWRLVDDELARRHTLTPSLVHEVRRLAPEAAPAADAVLTAVSRAAGVANSMPGRGWAASVGRRVEAEFALTGALNDLLGLAAGHPRLSADEGFLDLRQELRETEERIAVAGRHYNDAVRVLNARAERFSSSLVVRLLRIDPAEPFDAVRR